MNHCVKSIMSPRQLYKVNFDKRIVSYYQNGSVRMSATPPTVLHVVRSFWNFADVFFIKMYTWFGHYRRIIFPTFLQLVWTYSFFGTGISDAMSDYFLSATPPTVLVRFLVKFYKWFVQGLQMWIWFAHYSQSIFFTFSTCELRHFLVPQMQWIGTS